MSHSARHAGDSGTPSGQRRRMLPARCRCLLYCRPIRRPRFRRPRTPPGAPDVRHHLFRLAARRAARPRQPARRPDPDPGSHRRCLPPHQRRHRPGRAGRRARRRRQRQRAGRGPEEAGRDLQRHPARRAQQRRPPRRHGLGGDGRPVPDPRRRAARPLPAAVRPARRLLEHRHQRVGGHNLLGAGSAGRQRCRRSRPVPAAGHGPGRRRLCRLRPVDPAHPDPGPRRARLHPGPPRRRRSRDRGRVHPDPGRHDDPCRDPGVRHQHVQPALLGSAGAALRRRAAGRQGRCARQGLQHALGRGHGRRRAPHPHPRRRVPVPARQQDRRQGRQAAPDVRGQPHVVAERVDTIADTQHLHEQHARHARVIAHAFEEGGEHRAGDLRGVLRQVQQRGQDALADALVDVLVDHAQQVLAVGEGFVEVAFGQPGFAADAAHRRAVVAARAEHGEAGLDEALAALGLARGFADPAIAPAGIGLGRCRLARLDGRLGGRLRGLHRRRLAFFIHHCIHPVRSTFAAFSACPEGTGRWPSPPPRSSHRYVAWRACA
ncbi:UNVERIFIED_CONTAM: hypothetical protein NCL1_03595 [Trichonephila clavipes]